MSVSALVTKVHARYGNMPRDTKLTLKERMATLLPTIDGLDTHVSNLQDMFDISETAGFPVDMDDQVEIFRESVCAQPLIGKLLETFDLEFPDAKTVSFDQVTAYLILHLPNLKHSQMTATRASANLVAATAYSTLEAESKRLKAENKKLKRKRTPTDKQRSKKDKKGKGKGRVPVTPHPEHATVIPRPSNIVMAMDTSAAILLPSVSYSRAIKSLMLL
jgi:hypothetical protein